MNQVNPSTNADDHTSMPPAEIARAAAALRAAPPSFRPHRHEFVLTVSRPRPAIWTWINDPTTFTRQPWPYRVEFLTPAADDGRSGRGGFEVGHLTTHHGPLFNLPGVITQIDPGEDGLGRHRELIYTYGANVLGMRAIRPTALRFWLEDAADRRTTLTMQLDSMVHPSMSAIWGLVQRAFWPTFKWSLLLMVPKAAPKPNPEPDPAE
ncbi:MAG: hypothetical protein AAFR38_10420 [Planctomycetota bacterium]